MNTVLYICIYHGMLMLSYFLFGACIIMFLWLGILMNLDAQCRIYVGFFKLYTAYSQPAVNINFILSGLVLLITGRYFYVFKYYT